MIQVNNPMKIAEINTMGITKKVTHGNVLCMKHVNRMPRCAIIKTE